MIFKIIAIVVATLSILFSSIQFALATNGQLDIVNSVTEPVSATPYVRVYVKRFSIPSQINITDVSGSISLTSGLPYIAQGAFAIWYNTKGNCPADESVYSDYSTIWNGENVSLFWMNTILSKPDTIQVPTEFHFPVKRSISGCGFITFDMASYPNTTPPTSGLTLASNVTLHYDTDLPIEPQPYMTAVGSEVCFGSNQGCHKTTTCTSSNCAFMNVTKIISPTYLWSLFGDVTAGVFTGPPYANPPTGSWSSSQDTYIYKNCSSLESGFTGPSDYYNQIPADATPLLGVPIQSHDSEDANISVNKPFSTPILLKPGNCIVNLTRFSASNGGVGVNTAVYALLQAAPSSTVGYLDGATCSVFGGWVGNKDKPTTTMDVHFYADGVGPSHLVGKITANATRQKPVCDAIGSSESPCKHGFVFTTPSSLKDGKPHTIDAYAINGDDNPKLIGSGKTITCAATIPGDLNGDGKVNVFDYNELVSGYGTKYTIFDYNNLVANYGK